MLASVIFQALPFAAILEQAFVASLLAACTVTSAVLAFTANMFHSPHDVIGDVGVAYGPSRRKTVFVVSRHNLFRSGQERDWQRLTSGLGPYKLSSLAVSPAFERDQTVFVGSFGGGIFRTTNGGLSWEACNAGLAQLHVLRVVVAPDFEHSGVVIALGLDGRVYLSRDRGATWHDVFDPKHPGLEDSLRVADSQRAAAVLLDPLRDAGEGWKLCHRVDGVTCAGFATDGIVVGTSDGALHCSRNSGDSWTLLARLPIGSRVTCVDIPSTRPLDHRLFVGTEADGVFTISESGTKLERVRNPDGLRYVTALASYRRADDGLDLLACSWKNALFVSRDQGASWSCNSRGLTTHRQADEQRFGAPHFSVIAVAGGSHAEIYLGGFDGLFRAADPHGKWESVETLAPGLVIDLAVSPPQDARFSIAVSTYGGGVEVRRQGEHSWKFMNSGLSTTRIGPLRFSPTYATDRTLFAGSEGRVLVSRDGGAWQSTALSPQAGRAGSVRLFARLRAAERLAAEYLSAGSMKLLKALFQAAVLRAGGRVSRFVFPTVIAFSPDYGRDQTVFVGTRAHGIFRSQNGGQTFHQHWHCSDRFVFSLGVSPCYTADGILFTSLSDGLYRSRNGGAAWTREQSGQQFQNAALAVSPTFEADRTVFVGGAEGLYRSRDAGESWYQQSLTSSGEAIAIGGIALSPIFATDRTLLVHGRGHGLFRSFDGGESFERLAWKTPSADHGFCPLLCFPDSTTLFQFSPRYADDRTVIAAGTDQVYTSADQGLTWTALDRATRYENSRAEIVYRGRWALDFHETYSAQQAHRSQRPSDTATLGFLGTRIAWLGAKGPDHGMANVFVDERFCATVDLYSAEPERSCELYSTSLPHGLHRITVQVHSQGNPRTSGRAVTIDAFDVHVDAASARAHSTSVAEPEWH